MKRHGILNSSISKVLSDLGHTDTLTIADAGLPISEKVKKIDISLRKNLPSFIDTLKTIMNDMVVERVIVAEEIKTNNTKVYSEIISILGNTPITFVNHDEFKQRASGSRAVIRTGEMTPFANIILVSGINFSGGSNNET